MIQRGGEKRWGFAVRRPVGKPIPAAAAGFESSSEKTVVRFLQTKPPACIRWKDERVMDLPFPETAIFNDD